MSGMYAETTASIFPDLQTIQFDEEGLLSKGCGESGPAEASYAGRRDAFHNSEKERDTARDSIFTDSDTRMLFSADGTVIHANAVGNHTKQAIVFIHGFAWSLMAFDDICADPQWTSEFYIVRYDVRGHGRSGKPDAEEAWESKRFAEDFDTVVGAFKLHRPFVVGWSLGASLLIDILSCHPVDHVAGIINIAGATYISEDLIERLGSPLVHGHLQKMMYSANVDEFQQGAIGFIDGCCPTLSYEVRQLCLGSIMTQPQSVLIRSIRGRKQDQEVFERLGDTRIPCLVIYGDKDELVLVHRLSGYYRHWKNVTVEVVEGGSHIPWSKTDKRAAGLFNEKMLRWLHGVMSSTRS